MQKRDIAIQVSQLGKCYQIYNKPLDRVKQALLPHKAYYREFWALQDINFTIKKGESFGIIGRNGSGKSTLLQLLCKTLTPTTGNIEIHGRVAALLELGAGFNPEFTGRENVYLNGTIHGLSQKKMATLFDEIADFADIGAFIDQPVKTYSSGMFVRLAFAVQACIEPDILIVDEALSVGDIFFQQKCARRMQQLRERGTTLIFVSHDMATVRDLCEKAIYLQKGNLIFSGSSVEAVRQYFSEGLTNNQKPEKNLIAEKSVSESQPLLISEFKNTACWLNENTATESTEAKLIAITVTDEQNTPTMKTGMTQTLKFRVLYQSFTTKPVHVAIVLRNRHNHIIHCSSSYTNNIDLPKLSHGEYAIFELDVDCMLEAGSYTFSASLAYIDLPNRGVAIDDSPWIGPLTITFDYENTKAPWLGMFGIPTRARVLPINTN